MSIKLMSVVWDVEWPTQSQLIIALKLADYANDDGEKVYPAKATLAKKAHCSESTVKATLRAFRQCGILHTVHEGGGGPKDTTVYRLNVSLLEALADGLCTITGCSDTLEIDGEFPDDKGSTKGSEKGSNIDPLEGKRGQSGALRGQSDRAKGSASTPQSTNIDSSNRFISAHERASDEGARAPRALLSRTMTFLTPIDGSKWDDWMAHLETLGRSDLVQAARRAGKISVTGSTYPSGDRLPTIEDAALASLSVDRMLGGSR